MGNLVEYHNDINKIPLRNFNEKELNLFFTIIYKAKNESLNVIKLDFVDLKKLALTHRADERLIKSLEGMNKKLLSLDQKITLNDGKIIMFNLFNTFMIDPVEKNMIVKINENFEYMLNDLPQYTKFELSQLVSLRSSYAKNMFRLLKQFESTNYFIIVLDEFKRMLCVPNGYKNYDIDRRVLAPIMEELSPIFPNLKLEKGKKGRKITNFKFTWGNRNLLNGEIAPGVQPKKIEEVEISEGLYNIFEKVKKNRFIKPLITTKNIAHLVNEYSELELIEGLNFAYKEIKTEIKSINYLIKTINTGITKEEIKIVVKKSESKDLQGVEPKGEVKEELTEEIKEPIKTTDKDLEFFREEILKELENQKTKNKKLKHGQFSVAKVLIGKAQSYEQINELILKYELNEEKN